MTDTGTPGADGTDAGMKDAGMKDAGTAGVERGLRAAMRAADDEHRRAHGPGPAADADAWAGVRAHVERRRRRRRAAPAVAAAAAGIAVLAGTAVTDGLGGGAPEAASTRPASGPGPNDLPIGERRRCLESAVANWGTPVEGSKSIDIPGGGTAAVLDGGADGLALLVMRRAPETRECRTHHHMPRSSAAIRWTAEDGSAAWVGTTVSGARSLLMTYRDGAELEFRCGSGDRTAEVNCHRWTSGGRSRLMFATRPRPDAPGGGGENRPGVVRALDGRGRVIDSMPFPG
ncbi:hypothetical protein AB0L25_35580 [Spirillospora sp. NPDC052242]